MGIIQILCKLDIIWHTLEVEVTFSALCSILYMTAGSFSSSQIVKFPWLMMLSFGQKCIFYKDRVYSHGKKDAYKLYHNCALLFASSAFSRPWLVMKGVVRLVFRVFWPRIFQPQGVDPRSFSWNCDVNAFLPSLRRGTTLRPIVRFPFPGLGLNFNSDWIFSLVGLALITAAGFHNSRDLYRNP